MQVMILDNDRALLRSLSILLERAGHAVRAFEDADPALAALASPGTAPDALVLDYVMPQMNGLEFLRRARTWLPAGCRVILISGHTDLLSRVGVAQEGVDALLPKPLDLDELDRLICGCSGDASASSADGRWS